MTTAMATRLFGPVMFWTALTGIFAWLPLVRIIGRPEGYTWAVGGVSGEGLSGPFLMFVPLTIYVLAMLFTTLRGPRALAHPMLVVWHVAVTSVVIAGVVTGGTGATWQGQGLRFEVPLWLLTVPFAGFTVLVIAWVVLDRRGGGPATVTGWTSANSRRLAGSLVVLVVALVLFRAGTNYNGVTAAAIVATIVHWSLLIDSFAARRQARST